MLYSGINTKNLSLTITLNITIVGGHGQIAMLLYPILREKGHRVRGIIRNPDQAEDLRKAKAEADEALRNSGLDYTILKPGRLTNEPGTGKVTLAPELPRGKIPREDVAAVLAEILETPETIGSVFDLVSGDTPVAEAVKRQNFPL